MGNMRFKVGDRVRIKSLDWYNENKGNADKTNSVWCKDGAWFFYHMSQSCGKIMTIKNVWANSYTLAGSDSRWTDEMIDCLVEEEIIDIDDFQDDNEIIDVIDEYVHRLKNNECQINLPEGYQFTDENGNVINAMKIVLERKKKEYPKTYEECCKVLNIAVRDLDILDNMLDTTEIIYSKNLDRLLNSFRKLIICRDAYWKIAGEDMGLGKPWEPDGNPVYAITRNDGYIVHFETGGNEEVLEFPTAEMRDAFKENFDPDIEFCKEFL